MTLLSVVLIEHLFSDKQTIIKFAINVIILAVAVVSHGKNQSPLTKYVVMQSDRKLVDIFKHLRIF